jgi:membrane-bound lytic murein transglycosylase D
MPRKKVLNVALASVLLLSPSLSVASPGLGSNLGLKANVSVAPRQGPFQTPAKLRGRVDFWKDVFAKYGKNQVVVHHREFPQIVFGVLDFTNEAQEMNPIDLARHRSSVEKNTVEALKRQLEPLARGERPSTDYQEKIVRLMENLPGGASKYRRLIDEDLIRTQTGIRERYAEAIRRSWKYLPVMEQIFVSEYGLPKELTRIPFIESSFDYTAYSSVGAAGIWQFMPRTARSHKLLVGSHIDERRDPIKATRAAAEYLRSAYRSLGAWPLAITSYNHGVGGVRGKVSKAGTNDLSEIVEHPTERYFGFASSNFFPEFLAALEIFDDHKSYFPEIVVEPPLRVVSYPLHSAMSIGYVSSRLGVPVEDLREANYAILETVWQGRAKVPAGYVLRVPVQYQERVNALIKPEPVSQRSQVTSTSSAIYGGATYRVRKGDTLTSIAKRYGTTTSLIMSLNGLTKPTVTPGQVLVVKDKGDGPTPSNVSSKSSGVKQASTAKKPSTTAASAKRGKQTAKPGSKGSKK